MKFGGYEWELSAREGYPGPNKFLDSNVNVKEDGLHLKITKKDNGWYCAEAYLTKPLGYGKYNFTIIKPALLDKNAVLGLFAYENDDNEIDIEFSRWGFPLNFNAQFVVQPGTFFRRKKFFSFSNKINLSFNWQKDKIEFSSDSYPFHKKWIFKGENFLQNRKKEKLMLNFWLFKGRAPKKEQEVVIEKFWFEKR